MDLGVVRSNRASRFSSRSSDVVQSQPSMVRRTTTLAPTLQAAEEPSQVLDDVRKNLSPSWVTQNSKLTHAAMWRGRGRRYTPFSRLHEPKHFRYAAILQASTPAGVYITKRRARRPLFSRTSPTATIRRARQQRVRWRPASMSPASLTRRPGNAAHCSAHKQHRAFVRRPGYPNLSASVRSEPRCPLPSTPHP